MIRRANSKSLRNAIVVSLVMAALIAVGPFAPAVAHRQQKFDPRDNEPSPLDLETFGMDHADGRIRIAVQMHEPWKPQVLKELWVWFETKRKHKGRDRELRVSRKKGKLVAGLYNSSGSRRLGPARVRKETERTILLSFERRLLGHVRNNNLGWHVNVLASCADCFTDWAPNSGLFWHRLD